LDVGEAPENFLQKIVNLKPSTVIIIDAVELNSYPGTIKIIETEGIKNWSISTHSISLKLTFEYLKKKTKANIFLLGVQPENIKFGESISQPVSNSLDLLVRVFREFNAKR